MPPHPACPALRCTPRAHRTQGFTLLELLLVVALAGIVLSMVVFTATPNPSRQLEQDAQKLAQVLRLAQDEAQVRGRPLQWQGDADGWRFLLRSSEAASGWQPMRDDLFGVQRWSSRLDSLQWQRTADTATTATVSASPNSAPNTTDHNTLSLLIGQETIGAAYVLQLRRAGWLVRLSSNGAGEFSVSAPEALQP